MKSQTLNLTMEKPAKLIMLSVALPITLVNTVITLPVNAQSYSQDSYLPPEVVPVNQAINYGNASSPAKAITNVLPAAISGNNAPTVTSPITQQSFQTPQEARQSIYDSWLSNKIFPQSNGQTSYNETANPMNNFSNQSISNQNAPIGQMQNVGQVDSTANNYQNNVAPPQTQTLSGATNTPSTSQQQTTGGISHAYWCSLNSG